MRSASQPQAGAVPVWGRTARAWPVLALAAVLLLVLGLALNAWFSQKRIVRLESAFREVLLQDQFSLEQVVNADSGSPRMMYQEFFRICDQSITAREGFIARLNSIEPDVNHPLRSRLISHLKARNDLVRRKREAVEKRRPLSQPAAETARALWARFRLEAYDRFLAEEKRIDWVHNQVVKEVGRMTAEALAADTLYDTALNQIAVEEHDLVISARDQGLALPEVLRPLSVKHVTGASAHSSK